jgi:hypothetical protein
MPVTLTFQKKRKETRLRVELPNPKTVMTLGEQITTGVPIGQFTLNTTVADFFFVLGFLQFRLL